jgi:uncharacterized cupredoxin-like copper-binding protein
VTGIVDKLLRAAAVAACVVVAGCSGSDTASVPGAATLNVVQRDFRISAPDRVDAGPVHLTIDNRGPDAHEFVLLHADGSKLPLRDDGLTVDEDAVESRTVTVLEPAQPGVRELDVELAPGRYVMLCNMSGHMLGGMRRELVVQ